MIFFVGNDGTITKSDPSPVYQGSANTNDFFIVAPFASNLSATIAFKLPNGVWTDLFMLTPVGEIPQTYNKFTGTPYSGWKFSLPNTVTKLFGTVIAQIYFYPAQGGTVTATSYTSFEVSRGVSAQLPEEPSDDIYAQILAVISEIQNEQNNGFFAARALIGWHTTPFVYSKDELVYYPDKGANGTFLQSLKDNNTAQPYDEQGNINSDSWKEIANFDYISEQIFKTMEQFVVDARSSKEAAEAAQAATLKAKEEAEQAQTEVIEAKEAAQTAAEQAQEAIRDIDNRLSNVYSYRGSVKNYSDLPTKDLMPGYVYNVENAYESYPAGTNFAWTAEGTWDALGGVFDMIPSPTEEENNKVLGVADGKFVFMEKSSDTVFKTITSESVSADDTQHTLTVVDGDITENCHIDLFPNNAETEQFLSVYLGSNVLKVLAGSFVAQMTETFTKATVPANFSAYYSIVEVKE